MYVEGPDIEIISLQPKCLCYHYDGLSTLAETLMVLAGIQEVPGLSLGKDT
jgi:hypothetical protein